MAYRRRIHLYHGRNEFNAEVADVKEALKLAGDDKRYLLFSNLAASYKRLDRLNEALEAINESIKAYPKNSRDLIPFSLKGEILMNLKREDEARVAFETAINIDKNNKVLLDYCEALYRTGDVGKAYDLIRSINPTCERDKFSKAFHWRCIAERLYDSTKNVRYLNEAIDAFKIESTNPNYRGKDVLRVLLRKKEQHEKSGFRGRSRSPPGRYGAHAGWKRERSPPSRNESHTRGKRDESRARQGRERSPPSRNESRGDREMKSKDRRESPSRRRSSPPRSRLSSLNCNEVADIIGRLGPDYRDYTNIIIRSGITGNALKLILRNKMKDSVGMLADIGIKDIHAAVIISTFTTN